MSDLVGNLNGQFSCGTAHIPLKEVGAGHT